MMIRFARCAERRFKGKAVLYPKIERFGPAVELGLYQYHDAVNDPYS